eukprot:TRINITY_DN41152_c0_g1_i1.p1 TRINITY_DN41152_c0_g1~~TRINITY_DN41152_c0_g1_i1.p1  ORF type:complete len:333 (+),score=46.18 TRINITY_DN41152_c0_g1_i1:133-1131(+)
MVFFELDEKGEYSFEQLKEFSFSLRDTEPTTFPSYVRDHHHRAYVGYRSTLTDWLTELCTDFKLSRRTLQTGVAILDRVMTSSEIGRNRSQLIAGVCLLISAKYHEKEDCIPSTKLLQQRMYPIFDAKIIIETERYILPLISWDVGMVTCADYLDLFARLCVEETDTQRGSMVRRRLETLNYLSKYASFFSDLSVLDPNIMFFPASLVGVAAAVAARRALNIQPLWNATLEAVSGYSFSECHGVAEDLWGAFKRNFPNNAAVQEDNATSSPTSVTAMVQQRPHFNPQKVSSGYENSQNAPRPRATHSRRENKSVILPSHHAAGDPVAQIVLF